MRSILLIFFSAVALLTSCRDRNGCTDPTASNYSSKAENDDGSCIFNSDYFVGQWISNDSVSVMGEPFVAELPKIIDIRVKNNNPSGVLLFWKYADGQYSDTLDCTTSNLALSIPEQDFGNESFIKGSILYSSDGLVSSYEVRRQGILTEYKGLATKKP